MEKTRRETLEKEILRQIKLTRDKRNRNVTNVFLERLIQIFAELREMDPNDVKPLVCLGLIHGHLRYYNKAIDLLKKVLLLDPRNKTALRFAAIYRQHKTNFTELDENVFADFKPTAAQLRAKEMRTGFSTDL